MDLKVIRHLWGIPHPVPVAAAKAAEAGYQGLEMALLGNPDAGEFNEACQEHGLELIVQIHTDDFRRGGDVDTHLADFRAKLTAARAFNPIRVNSHSGADAWSFADAKRFFTEANAMAADEGYPVSHETHRSRVLFNPFVTRDLLDEFADLRLTADFSHWTCVCERLLDGEAAIIEQAAAATDYVHARVGHSQGPQVPDPRAPEAKEALDAFTGWWQQIWAAQAAAGTDVSYACPEFGPQPYLPSLPFTNVPVTDLNAVCNWVAGHLRSNFP